MAGCYPVWEQSGLFTTKGRSAPHLCVWPSNSAAPTTCNHGSIRLQIWQSVATAWGWNQLKVYLLICLAVDSGCLVRPQLRLPHDLFIRPHNMAASEQSNFLNSISGLQKRMSQWQVHHLFWHSLLVVQYYFHCILFIIIDSKAHLEFKGRGWEGCQDQIVKEHTGWEILV